MVIPVQEGHHKYATSKLKYIDDMCAQGFKLANFIKFLKRLKH